MPMLSKQPLNNQPKMSDPKREPHAPSNILHARSSDTTIQNRHVASLSFYLNTIAAYTRYHSPISLSSYCQPDLIKLPLKFDLFIISSADTSTRHLARRNLSIRNRSA